MTGFEIREISESSLTLNEVVEFITNNWPRAVALADPQFYKWQFMSSPDAVGKDRSVAVIDGGGRICGYMGLNQHQFNLDGSPLVGAELTTWVISPEYQGLGLGKMIVQYLQQNYEVLLGMGVSDMALRVYLPNGFKWLRQIPRYIKILNIERVSEISEISKLGARLIEQHSRQRLGTYHAEEITVPSNLESLIGKFHNTYNAFKRDEKYLLWRYISHPVFTYQMLRVSRGSMEALVVLRLEQKDHYRILHVIDVIAESEALQLVADFVEDYGHNAEVDFIDLFCTSSHITHEFWHRGWSSAIDDTFIQVPHLFYPIEMRTPPTTSMVMWSRSNSRSLMDISSLYVSKGDCDFDRPTMEYIEGQRGNKEC